MCASQTLIFLPTTVGRRTVSPCHMNGIGSTPHLQFLVVCLLFVCLFVCNWLLVMDSCLFVCLFIKNIYKQSSRDILKTKFSSCDFPHSMCWQESTKIHFSLALSQLLARSQWHLRVHCLIDIEKIGSLTPIALCCTTTSHSTFYVM